MNFRRIPLLLWLVLTGVFGGPSTSLVHGNEFESKSPGDFDSSHTDVTQQTPSTLRSWRACPRPQFAAIQTLCDINEGYVDVVAYNLIVDLLFNGVNDIQTLCVIDSAVVRSQGKCVSAEAKSFGADSMGALMRLLALKWQQLGELERADQLYGSAYGQLKQSSLSNLRQGVLHEWSLLKVERGEQERAVELMRLHTADVRKDYETGKFSVTSLIRALRLEAQLLDELGHTSEAQAAREEAERLESK